MKVQLLVIVIFTVLSQVSLTGEVGNGGDAVVCKSSVTLYDFHEAQLRSIHLDLGSPNIPFMDKVHIALDRLSRVAPLRTKKYRGWANSFLKEALIAPMELVNIDDSEHFFIPPNCKLKQLVIQRKPEFEGDKLYNVDQRLWDKMDMDHKAITILHEIIYREALEYGHQNSKGTRYANSYLFSHKLDSISSGAYALHLKKAQFLGSHAKQYITYNDVTYSGKARINISLHESGQLKDGFIKSGVLEVLIEDTKLSLPPDSRVGFHPDGSFKNVERIGKLLTSIKKKFLTFRLKENSSLYLFPNGLIKTIYRPAQSDILIQSRRLLISSWSIDFHPNGQIKKAELITHYGDINLKMSDHTTRTFRGGKKYKVYFNEQGLVLK